MQGINLTMRKCRQEELLLAEHYQFDDVSDRILEHIIQETKDEGLVRKAIQGKWNLDKFIEEAGIERYCNQKYLT